ncbi:PaaI family thioesterase [Rhodococcus sp. HM1]|uniref:PaaI family thioesterase n=1 Tax=Rhodococcus sp. HM1 TaxID=2937759 RepID=UPI00200B7C2C|nr:PaaI family thioesterase [Rhodococcus sp. HM1]MCK8671382.1 PaaI family thioesterase [Rhodococcus sp. HM1]
MTDVISLYINDGLSEDEVAHQAALYGPLVEDIRALIPLGIATQADDDEIRRAREHLAAAAAILGRRRDPGPYGTRFNDAGQFRSWGNAALGLRNAVAPPLEMNTDPDGRVWTDFHLHIGYEGPAGHTHGGVSALVLDQVLGDAARVGGSPGMTGTLTLRYRKPTPLGDLHAEAKLDRREGRKAFVTGHIAGPDGICVEAEGIFISPPWIEDARTKIDAQD